MSDLTILIIASLAVFRLAELVTVDSGPWKMFERLRKCSSHPMVCELVSCPYCCGLHISWMATLFIGMRGYIQWEDFFPWTMAIAGGAVAIMRLVRKRE